MAKKTFAERRAERNAKRKKRWERGETGLQKAALFIKNRVGGKKGSVIDRAGSNVAQKQRTAKDMDQAAKTRKSGKSITAKAGFSDKERVALKQKHEDWKANRAKMQKMRKENPKKYREIKRAQRKKERQASMRRSSSTWD
tara:strand:- start:191 stop:613 length:423 start_codon:yes stop_codon:yes gene_type:complete